MKDNVFLFFTGWFILIMLFIVVSKSRLGYTIEYYGLIILILSIIGIEYKHILPLLTIESPGTLERDIPQGNGKTANPVY